MRIQLIFKLVSSEAKKSHANVLEGPGHQLTNLGIQPSQRPVILLLLYRN